MNKRTKKIKPEEYMNWDKTIVCKKANKGLEALKEIIEVDEAQLISLSKDKSKKRDVMLHRQWLRERANIIETELKEKETPVETFEQFVGEPSEVIYKKLKALEIIKRYPVEVISCWDTYSDWEEYRKDYYNKAERKGLIETKEEFELLKEVLL